MEKVKPKKTKKNHLIKKEHIDQLVEKKKKKEKKEINVDDFDDIDQFFDEIIKQKKAKKMKEMKETEIKKKQEREKGRRYTEDGLPIYTEEELGMNNPKAGTTPLCPFDCDCCH